MLGFRVCSGYLGTSQNEGVPFLGVPIIRTVVFCGLYWGPCILGNYHIGIMEKMEASILGLGPYAGLEASGGP